MSKSKFKVPKRIAGVKLRKPLRRNIHSLIKLANSDEGRALLGSAFGALVGVISERNAKPAKSQPKKA